jgi:hypothetical protein
MKYRIFAAMVAVITFAGAGLAMTASPARAASSFHICLLNARSLCLQSNGPGNQVTLTSGSSADFTVVNTAPDGENTRYQFENGSGNCLRAGDGGVVKIENGPCSGDADWWLAAASSLISYKYGDSILTHSAASGDNVWHEAFRSGDWNQWSW